MFEQINDDDDDDDELRGQLNILIFVVVFVNSKSNPAE